MPIIDIDKVELKDEERQRCEIYTRVMGYIRPTTEFNIGKKGEFDSRKCFTEDNAVKRMETLELKQPYNCECNNQFMLAAE